MSDKPIIHVAVGGNPTEAEYEQIRDTMSETFPDKDVVISHDKLSLIEIPALDDYADELAKRVAEEINDG